MFLGYNTNGLANLDLIEAVELLAKIGYRGVGITIDHKALPPGGPRNAQTITALRRLFERHAMRSVIETGARFLLDPNIKHEPTLLSAACRRRIDFYKYALDLAAELESDCLSLWSGVLRESLSRSEAMKRLVEGLCEVCDYAARVGVPVAFEPEPGMLIDSMAAFETLDAWPGAPTMALTLDIGHLHCQGDVPIDAVIRRWAPRLANVHLDDMRAGVHEHLMFGKGEIDFPPVLQALADVGYAGGVYVELSRHSHEGPAAAQQAFAFLAKIWKHG